MAVTITVQNIRDKFAEFDNEELYSDELIQFSIDIALLWMKKKTSISDDWFEMLALFLSAHFVYSQKRGEESPQTNMGSIASIGEGPSSTSYTNVEINSEIKGFLTSSNYGLKYLALLRIWGLQNGYGLMLNG
jgi:hypothetical protein